MKKIIIKIIQGFLSPFISNPKIFLKTKDIIFLNPAEHLYRLIQYIKSQKTNFIGMTIIDIGCADGGTSVYFAKAFNQCKVIGYEPIPFQFGIAKMKAEKHENIRIKNIALSNFIGTANFNITANFLSSSINEIQQNQLNKETKEHQKKFEIIEKQEVQVTTLDEEYKNIENILLIKMDTQGTELKVLEGGKNTLQKTKFVLIEQSNHQIYKDSCSYFETDEFLRKNGFGMVDIIVTYRKNGCVTEFDAIYQKLGL